MTLLGYPVRLAGVPLVRLDGGTPSGYMEILPVELDKGNLCLVRLDEGYCLPPSGLDTLTDKIWAEPTL